LPASETGVDPLSTEHVAPLVAYLAGPAAHAISGHVFVVHSGMIAVMAAPTVEQRFDIKSPLWTEDDLADTVGSYLAERDPERNFANAKLLSLPWRSGEGASNLPATFQTVLRRGGFR
jgi:3-oxoacyl-[acyl-carrier protein] reductase